MKKIIPTFFLAISASSSLLIAQDKLQADLVPQMEMHTGNGGQGSNIKLNKYFERNVIRVLQ